MPAFTTRYGLYKPGGGSTGIITPDEIADIDKLNGNFDVIDAALGSASGTSGSRPGSPKDGQIFRESDTGNTVVWSSAGSYWAPVGTPYCSSQSVRDSFFPNPKQGITCIRTDKGWTETYYELYNSSTNPSGAAIAGWYPVSGKLPKARIIMLSGGIAGIGASQFCFTTGYVQTSTDDSLWQIAYDSATGKLTPAVIGEYRARIKGSANASSPTIMEYAFSRNSSTSPTAHASGNVLSVNNAFSRAVLPIPFSGASNGFEVTAEASTAAVTDYFQIWFSGEPSYTNWNMDPQGGNGKEKFIELTYIGPPQVNH